MHHSSRNAPPDPRKMQSLGLLRVRGYRKRQSGIVEMLWIVAGLGLALAIASGIAWHLQRQLTQAHEDLGAARQSADQFKAAAASCSNSVLTMDKRAVAAENLWRAGKKDSDAYSGAVAKYVNELLTRERPAGLDECAATRKEEDDEIDRRAARVK